eukprot:3814939-Amphidinium_carterae.1
MSIVVGKCVRHGSNSVFATLSVSDRGGNLLACLMASSWFACTEPKLGESDHSKANETNMRQAFELARE